MGRELTYPLIKTATLLYSKADAAFQRISRAAHSAANGVLGRALTVDELTDITVALFDIQMAKRRSLRALYPWEREWLELRLPASPARILVAAAGDGAEVSALLAAGYEVDAFEPAPDAVGRCRELVGSRGSVFEASYQEFVDAVSEGAGELGRFLADRRYDAVVLGWGSLSHVYRPQARRSLLECCVKIAPEGPILASFWMVSGDMTRGRSERLGAVVGDVLARIRGVQRDPERLSSATPYIPGYCFTLDEIEALADGVGRVAEWGGEQQYPHVAFCPMK